MNKKLTNIFLAVAFAAYPLAVPLQVLAAEGVALSDKEMDEIAAGEWVLASNSHSESESESTNNSLKVKGESQSEIQAVSNSNIVDSAAAIQHNIANATEGAVDMQQNNDATVTKTNAVDTVDLVETFNK